jgi:hypothetical protein
MLQSWLSSSRRRWYPASPAAADAPLELAGARGERLSLQVAVRNPGEAPVPVRLEAAAPARWTLQVRRVGTVPVRHRNTGTPAELQEGAEHLPGYVPDPLFPENELLLPPGETHAFWITLAAEDRCEPGTHTLRFTVLADGRTAAEHEAAVRIHDLRLRARRDFRVSHWLYSDCLLDAHGCAMWDRAYWRLLEAYLQDLAAHGQDTLYVPVFTPPLDGVKRPSQLLHVRRTEEGGYAFDWRQVRRYVRAAQEAGITHFEWTHLFTQWGARHAIRVYEGHGRSGELLWAPETRALSETYRDFLRAFLPSFRRFLSREELLERSVFHLSDEPSAEHLDAYRKARDLLQELAPWMRVMDAVSTIDFARAGVTDTPVPSIRTARSFLEAGIDCWCYFCCNPRGAYLQRLVDTPLPVIRLSGWLFYRWPLRGFLHWGYNYWNRYKSAEPIDPYAVLDAEGWPEWAYGDCFQVYPGASGPVDSLRWELFAESLQDYALLQQAGVARDDPLLAPLRSFEDFPREAGWLATARRRVLERAAEA